MTEKQKIETLTIKWLPIYGHDLYLLVSICRGGKIGKKREVKTIV
jgi:hypothetical protein